MLRKRLSITISILIAFTILSTGLILGAAQDNNWSVSELTSNTSVAPVIDGVKDSTWNNANSSQYEYDNGQKIDLYVQHDSDNIYFLIVAKFATTQYAETFSVFLSNSNDSEGIFDKKQITLFNASSRDNDSSQYFDSHEYSGGPDYALDTNDEGFIGVAGYSNNSEDVYRYYEYKIQMVPSNNISADEDVHLQGFMNYAIKIGFNSTSASTEVLSNSLLIQIGPKSTGGENTVGTYNFKADVYIMVVMIVVSVITGIYGIAVIASKSKVGNIKFEEEVNNNA
ncbi:MAG: hypothetical protein ACTSVU_05105 [Promethearchaeota archaeon]